MSPTTAERAQPGGLPSFGGGPPPRSVPPVSNRRVAMIMLMAAETMLFTTLLGGYVVLRGARGSWPPPGLPRLPLAITWINTAILFSSCATMARAWRALKAHDGPAVRLRLLQTTVM